jgi:hypothetical protein
LDILKPIPLLAFGFGNLAMLGWLAAAAAPLLIHLWSRHRFREAPWAAMEFLLAAIRKNSRRLQLQQWLLLALRTLIIALVVLAVAEPYGEQLAASGTGAPTHKVLVIDGSLSMNYRDGNTSVPVRGRKWEIATTLSRFDQAKDLAAGLVRNSRSGDRFTVILMSSPARTIIDQETVDPSIVAAQIESLSQTHTIADLPGALALVDDALGNKTHRDPSPRRHEVLFFTDLQRASWQGADSTPQPAKENNDSLSRSLAGTGLGTQLAAIAERAGTTIVDVGGTGLINLAVTHITSPESFVTVGREIVIEATLRQFGSRPQPECRVELLIDDVPVAEQLVEVPAGGETTVQFTHQFTTPGHHALSVRTQRDQLTIDDARWLVVPVREEVRVLCVAGREGAGRYVADALNPNPAAPGAIRPIVVAEGDLAEVQLTDFDCVFLCNVAQLTPSEAERLARYAEAGGGVVAFLGDRVIPTSYNAFAMLRDAAENTEAQLFPARIGGLITEPQFGLDPLDYRHAIVAPFRGRERAGLLTTPVSRYFELDTSRSPPGVEVAAASRRGDPFVVTGPLGRGRTVLIATDGSLSSIEPTTGEPWTTWPTWPSFLPVVRELLAYAVSGKTDSWQQLVGTPLSGTVEQITASSPASAAPRDRLQIVRPDGSTAPVAWQTEGAVWQWSYSDTDLSGLYTARGTAESQVRQFALNIDPAESDPARIDPHELPPSIEIRATAENGARSDALALVTQAAWSGRLLWLAIALMLIESFLAWQFGRGTV